MKKYFKDQKFMLIYQHSEYGISVDNIAGSLIDDDKNSLVIAARGNEPKSGRIYVDNGHHFEKIDGEGASWYSTYSNYKYHKSIQNDIETIDAKDLKVIEFLEELVTFVEGQVVTQLITLAFDEEGEIDGADDNSIKLIKRGGAELVVEFMLSKFIEESYRGWFYKSDGRPLEDENYNRTTITTDTDLQSIHNWGGGPFTSEEMSLIEEKWHYDFTMFDDLSAMDGQEHPLDPEYDSVKYLYQYNISKKHFSKYKKLIEVPFRVYEILTSDQRLELSRQVYGILQGKVDDVGRDIFGLKFESFFDDEEYRKSMQASRQWGVEMYGSLSTSEGNIYLSDGMSLDSKGNLVDD